MTILSTPQLGASRQPPKQLWFCTFSHYSIPPHNHLLLTFPSCPVQHWRKLMWNCPSNFSLSLENLPSPLISLGVCFDGWPNHLNRNFEEQVTEAACQSTSGQQEGHHADTLVKNMPDSSFLNTRLIPSSFALLLMHVWTHPLHLNCTA